MTNPDALIEAIPEIELFHVPAAVAFANCSVAPIQSEDPPVILATEGDVFIVTVVVFVVVQPFAVTA